MFTVFVSSVLQLGSCNSLTWGCCSVLRIRHHTVGAIRLVTDLKKDRSGSSAVTSCGGDGEVHIK